MTGRVSDPSRDDEFLPEEWMPAVAPLDMRPQPIEPQPVEREGWLSRWLFGPDHA